MKQFCYTDGLAIWASFVQSAGMLLERKRGFLGLYASTLVLWMTGLFAVWYGIHVYFRGGDGMTGLWSYAVYALVLDTLLILHTVMYGEKVWEALSGPVSARLLLGLRQTVVLFVGLFLFLVASKDQSISRIFLFSLIPVTAVMLAVVNTFISRWMMPVLFSSHSREDCVLIDWGYRSFHEVSGHSSLQEKMSLWLERQGRYGIQIRGVLSSNKDCAKELQLADLGDPESAADLLKEAGITMFLLLQMPPQRNQTTHLLNLCERHGVRMMVVHDLAEHFGRPMELTTHDGVHLLQFRREPLQNPSNRILKRLLDLMVSLPVVLVLLPPLALVVWLLQRMHSPGPLFFTHGRNGRANEVFPLVKFRTMHVCNDDVNRQASRSDPRIYPGGDLLRKTSLDEIPQFLNVLRGEMSVVGPRPHLPQHNRLWQEITGPYNVRTFVKPGITGLAQTRGYRGEATCEEDIHRRVECDLEYIERWSLLMDVGLILRTAKQVIIPKKTAY